jgi:hypothetical protein
MLAKDPKQRLAEPSAVIEALAPFASGSDFAALLEELPHEAEQEAAFPFSSQSTASAAAAALDDTRTMPRRDRPRGMPRYVLVLSGLLAVAAVIVAAAFLLQGPEGQPQPGPGRRAHPTLAPLAAPFDAQRAAAQQERWATHLRLPACRENSIGMAFKLIPPGEFWMGSPRDAEQHDDDEGPLHRVSITKPFYIGHTR